MSSLSRALPCGAWLENGGARFRAWAPRPNSVDLVVDGHIFPAQKVAGGYWDVPVPGAGPGSRYFYRLDGRDVPDPCSRSQPGGVHAASEVVDPRAFPWTDSKWSRPGVEDLVVYECHIGTLTPKGTFDGAIRALGRIKALGATAIEVMPVASFPGRRNWGYDGVGLFAPAVAYGGPEAMRRLVDAAHREGLAVILDVVYNHFGPGGNYTGLFGAYQTGRHHTPWGDAVNFDDEGREGVREFVVANLIHWVDEYHIDGFRFDATHAIKDDSDEHILAEVSRRIEEHAGVNNRPYLIAESHENDVRYLRPRSEGGFGFDAVWADDFHSVVRNVMHSEREGYLSSFEGTLSELAHVISHGWLYEGQFDPWAKAPRGTGANDVPWRQFVYCLQNHDQVGNRAFGERANTTANVDDLLAATFLLLLLPQTPLLFQGQEFLATTPFQYFTDHNPELGRLVTEGRRREFAGFSAFTSPATRDTIPDPQAEATFLRSKLREADRERPEGRGAEQLHRELIALRFSDPVLREARADRTPIETSIIRRALLVTICVRSGSRAIGVNFGDLEETLAVDAELILHSREARFCRAPAEPRVGQGRLTIPPHTAVFVALEQ